MWKPFKKKIALNKALSTQYLDTYVQKIPLYLNNLFSDFEFVFLIIDEECYKTDGIKESYDELELHLNSK